MTITLHGYRLFSGCSEIQSVSPKICTMSPCPTCSLIACIIAQGLQHQTSPEQVFLDAGDRSISLIVSIDLNIS
jgi:hypothetical protein